MSAVPLQASHSLLQPRLEDPALDVRRSIAATRSGIIARRSLTPPPPSPRHVRSPTLSGHVRSPSPIASLRGLLVAVSGRPSSPPAMRRHLSMHGPPRANSPAATAPMAATSFSQLLSLKPTIAQPPRAKPITPEGPPLVKKPLTKDRAAKDSGIVASTIAGSTSLDQQESLASVPAAWVSETDMHEQLTKFTNAVQEMIDKDHADIVNTMPRSIEADVDQRMGAFMRELDSRLAKDRDQLVDTFVKLCASVEEKATSKIQDVECRVNKLQADFDAAGRLRSYTADSGLTIGPIDRGTPSMGPSVDGSFGGDTLSNSNEFVAAVLERMVGQIEGASPEVSNLRLDLSQKGILTSDVSSEPAESLSDMVAALYVKSMELTEVIRQMQEQHHILKESVLARTDLQAVEHEAPVGTINRNFTVLRDTLNKVINVLGQELDEQHQQRIQDYTSFAIRLESLEHGMFHIDKEPQVPTPLQSGFRETQVPVADRLLQLAANLAQVLSNEAAESLSTCAQNGMSSSLWV